MRKQSQSSDTIEKQLISKDKLPTIIQQFIIHNYKVFNNQNSLITLGDYSLFTTILDDYLYSITPDVLFTIKSSYRYSIIFNNHNNINDSISKVMFLLIVFSHKNNENIPNIFCYNDYSLLRKCLLKLYINNLISINNLSNILKDLIDMCTYSDNMIKPLKDVTLLRIVIKLFVSIIKKGSSMGNDINDFAKNFLSYFSNNIIEKNHNNIYILRKSNDSLKMLSISYSLSFSAPTVINILINLVIKIYTFNYTENVYKCMITNTKKGLTHIKNLNKEQIIKDIFTIKSQLDFTIKMIKKETNPETMITSGFVFNDTPNNGVTISKLGNKMKQFTILFSFIQEAQKENVLAPLIYLYNEDDKKKSLLLSISIINSVLIVQLSASTYEFKSLGIGLNMLYTVFLTCNSILSSSCNINIGINSSFNQVQLMGKVEKVNKCNIGFLVSSNKKYNFIGKIGPVLIYDDIIIHCINGKAELDISKMHNQYDKAIYDSSSNFNYINRKKFSPNIEKQMTDLLSLFQTEFYLSKLKIVISPFTIWNSFKSKLIYPCNYRNKYFKKTENSSERKIIFESIPIPENFSTYSFTNVSTISQLSKMNGVDYLILNIEYFYNLIRYSNENQTKLEVIDSIFETLGVIIECEYHLMMYDIDSNNECIDNFMKVHEKFMFSFICETDHLDEKNLKVLQVFNDLLNKNDKVPISFKGKYSFFFLDQKLHNKDNKIPLMSILPKFEDMIVLLNHNSDYFTIIAKKLSLDYSFLLKENLHNLELKQLLRNIYGICDIITIADIISSLPKSDDFIDYIEFILEQLFLRNKDNACPNSDDLLIINDPKDKRHIKGKEKDLETVNKNKELSNKEYFNCHCIPLLLAYKQDKKYLDFVQPILIRLLIEEGETDLNYSTKSDISLLESFQILNSDDNIFSQLYPNEATIKSLLLVYADYDKETVIKFIKGEIPFKDIRYNFFLDTPFKLINMKVLITIVKFINTIPNNELGKEKFTMFSQVFNTILILLIEKRKGIHYKNYNPRSCWFNYVFKSYHICSKFFKQYISMNGLTSSKEFLKYITQTIILYHPKPFVYSLYYDLIKEYKNDAFDYLCHFSFNNKSREEYDSIVIERNIIQYLMMMRYIALLSLPLDNFWHQLIEYGKYLINSTIMYSNLLSPLYKEDKMTILEIFVDILSFQPYDAIETIKSILYVNHEGDIVTLFYLYDKHNIPSDSKSKQITSKDIKNDNEIIERQDKSLICKVLEKYSEETKWLNDSIRNKLESERDLIKKINHSFTMIPKEHKQKISDNINSDIKVKEPYPLENELNDFFLNCYNEDVTLSQSKMITSINTSNTSTNQKKIIQEERNTSIIKNNSSNITEGFYDISIDNAVICNKKDLILKTFGIYFLNIYFNDEQFHLLESNFRAYLESITQKSFNSTEYLKFPSKIRNYSSASFFTPRIFLKKDTNFYTSKTFKISHSYYSPLSIKNDIKTYHNLIINHAQPYDNKFINLNTSLYKCKCELIKVSYVTTGTIYLLSNHVIFLSSKTDTDYKENRTNHLEYVFSNQVTDVIQKDKEILLKYNNIEEVLPRRFLYRYQAVEIFMRDGKSYLFNLYNPSNLLKQSTSKTLGLIDHLSSIKSQYNYAYKIVDNPKNEISRKNLEQYWKKNQLSTFEFLSLINKYSGRTFNDTNQYPIMPWVFLFTPNVQKLSNQNQSLFTFNIKQDDKNNKESNKKDNDIPEPKNALISHQKTYQLRKFMYPICLQNQENMSKIESKYKESVDNQKKNKKKKHITHLRLFYSTCGYIIFYMFRLNPFTSIQIRFQTNKFDAPARQFINYKNLFESLKTTLDNRELIPEVFSFIEYCYNINHCFFGVKQNTKELISNLHLPDIFSTYAQLTYFQMKTLNSVAVKKNINGWIDNVFGNYQYKPNNNTRMNIFDKYTYPMLVNLDHKIEKYKSIEPSMTEQNKINKIRCKADRILSFGQSPEIVFNESVKGWDVIDAKKRTDDDFSDLGSMMHINLICKDTMKDNRKLIYCTLTSKGRYIYTLIAEPKPKFTSTIMVYQNKEDFNNPRSVSIAKIKLFKMKMDLQQKSGHLFRYHIKYALFDTHDGDFFFTCRHHDNSIKIYNKSELVISYITDSFVLSLCRLSDDMFLSGNRNGRLIHWGINYAYDNKNECKPSITMKRSILAHHARITGVLYIQQHNIIITIGEDHNLFIRKYKTFELIVQISNKYDTDYFTDVAYSPYNFIFTMSIDTKKKALDKRCFYLTGYSMNGVCFYQSPENCAFNTFCINNNGLIITGLYDTINFELFSLEWGKKNPETQADLQMQSYILKFTNIFEKIKQDKEQFFSNFSFFDEDNTFYIVLTNKVVRIAYNDSIKSALFQDKDLKENTNTNYLRNCSYLEYYD